MLRRCPYGDIWLYIEGSYFFSVTNTECSDQGQLKNFLYKLTNRIGQSTFVLYKFHMTIPCFSYIFRPLDSSFSGGKRYPPVKQLGPEVLGIEAVRKFVGWLSLELRRTYNFYNNFNCDHDL